MTRMSRNFCGLPGARPKRSHTLLIITGIWLYVRFAQAIACVIIYGNDPGSTTAQFSSFIYSALDIAFSVYFLFAVINTRIAIRRRYQIPPGCCGECDDCCCTFWCPCCTVSTNAGMGLVVACHSLTHDGCLPTMFLLPK